MHDWKDIIETAVSAVEEALENPHNSVKSEIGLA